MKMLVKLVGLAALSLTFSSQLFAQTKAPVKKCEFFKVKVTDAKSFADLSFRDELILEEVEQENDENEEQDSDGKFVFPALNKVVIASGCLKNSFGIPSIITANSKQFLLKFPEDYDEDEVEEWLERNKLKYIVVEGRRARLRNTDALEVTSLKLAKEVDYYGKGRKPKRS